MSLIFLILCLLAVDTLALWSLFNPIVKIEHGWLEGKIQSSILNRKTFYSFKGIPYAAPPTGKFRFREPQPVQKWYYIRNAKNYGSACPQTDVRQFLIDRDLPTNVQGNENCLFLNVFTPSLPKVFMPNRLKPVMFYIHGGAFFTGSGDDLFYGPDHLMEEDVVYVSINYRLGALGFLSLENVEVPGNFGLKDQVQALKWVKKNIAAFDGDPNRVTIFGQSAGGASVSLLMLSPLAQGLFHKVIAQSGTTSISWALTEQRPLPRAFKLGELLGLQTNNSTILLEYLRNQDAMRIAELSRFGHPDYFDLLPDYSKAAQFPFSPTIEPEEVGTRAFLTENPETLLRNGQFTKLPLLMGETSHEFIVLLKKIDLEPAALIPTIENLNVVLPIRNYIAAYDSEEYRNVISTLKDTYSLNQFTSATAENYVRLGTAEWITVGVELEARLQINVQTENVYYYRFSYNGSFNTVKVNKDLSTELPGAAHGDEFCYQFYCRNHREAYKNLGKSSRDYKMIKVWSRLFSNFAKTGNPTPVNDSVLDNVKWLPRTIDVANSLQIDDTLIMDIIPGNTTIDTWLDLMETLDSFPGDAQN